MPRLAGKKKDAIADELASFNSKKEAGPQKINLGDGASLKRALDDAAAAVSYGQRSRNVQMNCLMACRRQSLKIIGSCRSSRVKAGKKITH